MPAKVYFKNLENLSETFIRLKSLIDDPNCIQMNQAILKGYLGELLVGDKLHKEGLNLILKGNQSGYDLEVEGKDVKIDVKLSKLKDQCKSKVNHWGWALKQASKKTIKSTHLVCVALGENLEPLNYYVIKSQDLDHFPASGFGQFSKVERGLVFIQNKRDIQKVSKDEKEYFDICQSLLDNGTIRKIAANRSLAPLLR